MEGGRVNPKLGVEVVGGSKQSTQGDKDRLLALLSILSPQLLDLDI